MPNWCGNYVSFFGEKNDIQKLKDVISKLDESSGGLLHSGNVINSYFFDVYIAEDSDDYINIRYESKWDHNKDDVAAVCKEFNLTAEASFDEEGNNIIGTCLFKSDGTYECDYVSPLFFYEIEWSEKEEAYEYRGNWWNYLKELVDDMYQKWVYEMVETMNMRAVISISDVRIKESVNKKIHNEQDAEKLSSYICSVDHENVELGLLLLKNYTHEKC